VIRYRTDTTDIGPIPIPSTGIGLSLVVTIVAYRRICGSSQANQLMTLALAITKPKSWYSFHHLAEGRRLSWPRKTAFGLWQISHQTTVAVSTSFSLWNGVSNGSPSRKFPRIPPAKHSIMLPNQQASGCRRENDWTPPGGKHTQTHARTGLTAILHLKPRLLKHKNPLFQAVIVPRKPQPLKLVQFFVCFQGLTETELFASSLLCCSIFYFSSHVPLCFMSCCIILCRMS